MVRFVIGALAEDLPCGSGATELRRWDTKTRDVRIMAVREAPQWKQGRRTCWTDQEQVSSTLQAARTPSGRALS